MANTSFNWRDYVYLHPSLGAERAKVERVLDSIVATGTDGQELIRTMHRSLTPAVRTYRDQMLATLGAKDIAVAAPTKIEIRGDGSAMTQRYREQTAPGSHLELFIPGVINLSMREASRLAVNTPQGSKRLSLTGIVVHEFFHGGDINLRADVAQAPEKVAAHMAHTIPSSTLTTPERIRVLNAYYELVHTEFDKVLGGKPPKTQLEHMAAASQAHATLRADIPKTLDAVAARASVPPGSFTIASLTDPESRTRMFLARLAHAEEQATQYTDRFMAKHFPGEPWRGTYANSHYEQKAGDIIVRTPGCGIRTNAGNYTAESVTLESLGTLSQPRISPDPSPHCGRPR